MKKQTCIALLALSTLSLFAQNYAEPAPSPDGKKIAFTSDRDGNNDLYTANADGSDLRKIAGLPGYETHPRWSPDGSKILFNSFPDAAEKPHDVFTVNADGAGLTNLTNGKFHDGQADDWSPDGRRVLFSSGKYPGIQLYSMQADGNDVLQLTNDAEKVFSYASFDPSGRQIVLAVFTEKPGKGIYLLNADGSNLRLIRPGGDAPSWAPDGKKIVFQERRDGKYRLMEMNPDGSGVRALGGRDSEGETPLFTKDGTQVFYQKKNEAGKMGIHLLDLTTGVSTQILPKKKETASPPDAICRHIEVLASDEFQGRKPGTPGEEKTIRYIEEQFRQIGLQPGNGESFFQEIALAEFSTVAPGHLTLKGKKESLDWQWKQDYLLGSRRAAETIRTGGGFVFAGFGIHAPELGWSDYDGVDVRSKIVVVLSGSPDEYAADSMRWKGDPAANLYGQSFYKRNEAARQGAAGVLLIYKQPAHGFWTWESLGNTYGQRDIFLKQNHIEHQLDFAGLISKTAAGELFDLAGLNNFDFQKEALNPDFQAITLPVSTSFSFSNAWKDLPTHNVVGLLPGADLAHEAILYTAHWDHVGMGAQAEDGRDVIFNGAVDNASGTAALIEIARAYKSLQEPPRRSILFVATAAEEIGLLGAVAFAAQPIFPLGKTAAAFNMDAHFPYGKTKYVTGVVYGRSELDGYLEEAARQQGRILIPNTEDNIRNNIFFRSDHFPLAEAGIPAEFAVGAIGLDSAAWVEKMAAYMGKYHQVTDEYGFGFDCSGIWQDAELVFLAGKMLSQTNHFPAWDERQPFERIRRKNHYESTFYQDVTATHLPVMSLQGRSMDAKPADLDGDGDLDIVVANEHAFNIILVNDGKGKFSDETPQRLPLNRHDTEDIAIADFDGDGDLDLVFVSEDDRQHEYYENDGKGFFKDVSFKIPISCTANAVEAADLNGDGFPDLLIGAAPDRQGKGGQNICLINDGKGNWRDETAARLPVSTRTTQDIDLGDVDSDGDLDMVAGNEDDNELFINDGKGFFKNETAARLPVEPGKWETREVDFGDVDGDGDLDLFLANVNFRQDKDSQNRLFLNNGKGFFKDETADRLPAEKMHTVDGDFCDLDRDGDLDLLTGSGFGNSYNAYFNESGIFKGDPDAAFPASVRGDGIDIESADFNGDGVPDLYLCNFSGNDFLLFGK